MLHNGQHMSEQWQRPCRCFSKHFHPWYFLIFLQNGKLHLKFLFVCLYYKRVHLTLIQVFMTRKPNIIWKLNIHQSTTLTESRKTIEAHGRKPWVTNLSIVPHTLGVLFTTISYYIFLLKYFNKSRVSTYVG